MSNRTSPLTSLALAAAAVVLVAAVGGAAAARPSASGQQAAQAALPPPPPPPPPPGVPGLSGRALDALALTDAQRSEVRAIRDDARAAEEPYQAQLGALTEAVRAQVESGAFDENAVRAAAMDASQGFVELTVARARADAAVYQLLTAEQRARLASMKPPPPPRR